MIRKILLPALLMGLLGGCVTGYTYRADGGGYYYGQPSVEYRYYDYGYHDYGNPYFYGYYPYRSYYGYGYPYYYGYYGYPYGYPYSYRRHHHRKPPIIDPDTGIDPGTDPGHEPRDGATRNDFRRPPLRNHQPQINVPMQPAPQSMPRPTPQGPREEQSRRDPPARTESGTRRSSPLRRPTQSGTQER